MLFNSPEFLFIFLPLALLAFGVALRLNKAAALGVLLVASILFYSVWTFKYVPALLASMAVNYALGRALQSRPTRRLLAAGVALNLAPLLWIKYAHWLGGLAGVEIPVQELPLGISFVTFLQIAFLVEAWAGKLPPIHGLRYAVLVSYFPHLIAGPILRYGEIDPQLRAPKLLGTDDARLAKALLLIVVGLFKKVVLADWIGSIVDPIYANPESATLWSAWTAAVGYTCQLYLDFSGMCEIAMGVSMLFGVTIPLNFWSPYRAKTVSAFWRQWHMTLGAFFRDFVYVPLGGNRRGQARAAAALMITMVLAGVWHGAANTFLLWGALHGAALVAHKQWQSDGLRMPAPAAHMLTLLFVVCTWVVFRAASVEDATHLWKAMLGLNGLVLPAALAQSLGMEGSSVGALTGVELIAFVAGLAMLASLPNVHEWTLRPRPRWGAAMAAGALMVSFSLSKPTTFIYWTW